ncbi:MAG: acetyl-CoA carboxylase biotin carboxyl carrier protein [Planctomycetota bacterium]
MATFRKRRGPTRDPGARVAAGREGKPTNAARPASGQESGFTNLKKLRSLLELMSSNDVSEIEITEGETGVRIKRGRAAAVVESPAYVSVMPSAVPSALPAVASPVTTAAPPAAATEASAPEKSATPPARSGEYVEFVAPMVGTFYRASSPEAGPYVTEGDKVTEETVLCIIEAMKVMNEIKAEMSGEVVEVLVENGEAVEYGQPLFLLKKAS